MLFVFCEVGLEAQRPLEQELARARAEAAEQARALERLRRERAELLDDVQQGYHTVAVLRAPRDGGAGHKK